MSLAQRRLAELMGRLGHRTVGAALKYQHVAAGRDAQIAGRPIEDRTRSLVSTGCRGLKMSPPQFVITIYCDEPSHTKTPVGRYLMSNPLDVHTKLGNRRGLRHRRCGTRPQPLTLPEIATILRSRLGDRGAWIPTRVAPDWLVRPAARLVAEPETLAGLLGPPKLVSAAR